MLTDDVLRDVAYRVQGALVDNVPTEEIREVFGWSGLTPDDDDLDRVIELLYGARL